MKHGSIARYRRRRRSGGAAQLIEDEADRGGEAGVDFRQIAQFGRMGESGDMADEGVALGEV